MSSKHNISKVLMATLFAFNNEIKSLNVAYQCRDVEKEYLYSMAIYSYLTYLLIN